MASVSAVCPPACENGGACNDGETCTCPPSSGFGGVDCSMPVQHCDDGKQSCFNGSVCVRNDRKDPETREYRYHCDCSKAFDVSAYAGLQCEHSATESCEKGIQSEYSFCTNGGACDVEIFSGERHHDCICPADFTGSHCQYLIGEVPTDDLKETLGVYRGGGDSLGGGAIAFIVLISFAGAVAFGLFLWRFRKQGKGIAEVESTPDGAPYPEEQHTITSSPQFEIGEPQLDPEESFPGGAAESEII